MSTGSLARWLGHASHLLRQSQSSLWALEARMRGVELEGPVTFWGRPIIGLARGSRVELGSGVMVLSSVRATILGCFQPCVLRTMDVGAELILGRNVAVSAVVISAGRSIRIGEGTILGAGAMVLDNDFHAPEGECGWRNECRTNSRPVVIGRGVFIGARAIVLKGVTIGDRAVVGAGSVVTRDVPPGGLAAGNPAVIKPHRA